MVCYDLINLETLKEKLDTFRPLSPDVLNNLDKWFEIELTYTSNAIEGNTLTRSETALVIEKGLMVGKKPLKDHLEALNHKEALTTLRALI